MTETIYTTGFSQNIDISVKINTPGDMRTRRRPVVVINSGYRGTMDESHVRSLAGAICGSDMTAVRFDPPGIGKSGGVPEQDYRYGNSLRALGLVVQSILNRSEFTDARVGMWGYSMGADQSIQYAAEHQHIHALCLVAPAFNGISSLQLKKGIIPDDFYREANDESFRPSRHIAAVTAGLLFIAGTADTVVPAEQNTQRLLEEANGSKQMILIPGMSHYYWVNEHHRQGVYSHSTRFLKQQLVY